MKKIFGRILPLVIALLLLSQTLCAAATNEYADKPTNFVLNVISEYLDDKVDFKQFSLIDEEKQQPSDIIIMELFISENGTSQISIYSGSLCLTYVWVSYDGITHYAYIKEMIGNRDRIEFIVKDPSDYLLKNTTTP